MSSTKNKYYFKRNAETVIISDFDYTYVLNEVLKVYDPKSPKSYFMDFIIREGSELNKINLDLEKVYFDNDRINVMTLVVEDIYYSDKSNKLVIKDIKAPKIYEEYASTVIPNPPVQKPEFDQYTYKKPERIVVDASHILYQNLFDITGNSNKNALCALDWLVNTDLNMQESSDTINKITDKNLKMVSMVNSNSEYINNSVILPLSTLLKSMFVIKQNFISKFFNPNPEIKFDDFSTNDLIKQLRSILRVDKNQLLDVSLLISELKQQIKDYIQYLSLGIRAIDYKLGLEGENLQLSLYKERLQKIKQTVTITELNLDVENTKHIATMNKFSEMTDVLMPALCTQLQAQSNKPLGVETINIVRKLI